MFKYDKKIDDWSLEMIKGIDHVWGQKINTNSDNNHISEQFLIKYLDNYIEEYGEIIINKFNTITKLSYKISDFGLYVNRAPVSLHNGNQLYISIGQKHVFNSYPTIIIHELFHIYFYKYLESIHFLNYHKISNISDLITENDKNNLKEIITVLINSEFKDIIDIPDNGYPDHQKIREAIIEKWNKNMDFDKWISEVVLLYKKSGLQ